MSILKGRSFVVLSLFGGAVSSAHAVDVFFEDFSGGNPVSSTDYVLYNQGSYSLPDGYRVISNPSTDFINGYQSYFDHTVGTAAGKMLFFDGSANSNARIWYKSGVNLTTGTTYTFSYW